MKYGDQHNSSRILAVLMLAASLFQTTACQSGNPVSDTDTAATEPITTTEPVAVKETAPDFDRTDYGGEEFHILSLDWALYQNYFFADEMTGDVMNDAIYQREMMVEDYLGIDITYAFADGNYGNMMPQVKNSVLAGEDAYQLVLTHCIGVISSTMTDGILYDWNDIDSVDLTKGYWNQSCNDNLSLFGKQYYAISDYMLPDPNAILFNKDMVKSYSLENPYELVRSGNWTLDKLIEMSALVTEDLNGNSVYDINDQYGLGCDDDWMWNSFIYSSAIKLVDKDSAGDFTLTVNSDRMVGLVEKLDHFLNGTNTAFIWPFHSSADKTLTIASGKVLFQIEALNQMHLYRDTDVDYGILPYPKYDGAQDDYYNNDWSGLMCIPATVKNPEMVGKACELLAYYSGDTTRPAYYDLVLGEKLSRDEDSKEMLGIIYDNIIFDAGMNYFGFEQNMQKLFYTIKYLVIDQESGAFASWYAKYSDGAKAEIEAFMKKAAALE